MMRMTDPLTAVELPEGGALCAVSGGLDSMCLLEMTVRQGQKQGRRVAAAHFNHQLRGAEADRDEAFVRDWCAAREIPFFAGRGDVRAFAEETGRTVEEAARQLRYKFLEETRRREIVPLTEELRQKTQAMADEMNQYFARGYTPKVKPGTFCNACSLKALCLPVLYKRADPKAYLRDHLDEACAEETP